MNVAAISTPAVASIFEDLTCFMLLFQPSEAFALCKGEEKSVPAHPICALRRRLGDGAA
jgi:hypothetical protein